eukprot:118999_1
MSTLKEPVSKPSKMLISIDEYTAEDVPTALPTLSSQAADRSKNFNLKEMNKWGKKSVANIWNDMYEQMEELKIEYDVAAASGASDIDAMSDSDAQAIANDFAAYDQMRSEFEHVRSVSELKYEHNKAFSAKLNALHDKISVFIAKIANQLQHKKLNLKLKQSYQTACDFLADVQHEIDLFDEDIVENESKFKTMDVEMKHLQSKYEKTMAQLKIISAEHQDVKKQNYELSMERSQLMLSVRNSFTSAEDQEESSNAQGDKYKKVRAVQNTDGFKREDPYEKRLEQLEIDPQKHPYLYGDFEYDDNPCASIWQLFSKEIGFFFCNRSG